MILIAFMAEWVIFIRSAAEYIEVAKAFFDDDEPRLVNAVLDRIARELRPGEFKEAQPSGDGGAA